MQGFLFTVAFIAEYFKKNKNKNSFPFSSDRRPATPPIFGDLTFLNSLTVLD